MLALSIDVLPRASSLQLDARLPVPRNSLSIFPALANAGVATCRHVEKNICRVYLFLGCPLGSFSHGCLHSFSAAGRGIHVDQVGPRAVFVANIERSMTSSMRFVPNNIFRIAFSSFSIRSCRQQAFENSFYPIAYQFWQNLYSESVCDILRFHSGTCSTRRRRFSIHKC